MVQIVENVLGGRVVIGVGFRAVVALVEAVDGVKVMVVDAVGGPVGQIAAEGIVVDNQRSEAEVVGVEVEGVPVLRVESARLGDVVEYRFIGQHAKLVARVVVEIVKVEGN